MLQRIRDNASGPLAYVVVALITLVFGVWGIGSYFTPSTNPVVASVGSTDITRYQLQQAFDQRYTRLRQLMGDRFDPKLLPRDELRENVLQGMITNAVLDQHAHDAGYRVTDAGVLAAIRDDKRFQTGGKFSAQRYRALLAQAGIAPAQYEARLRKNLNSQQLRSEIVGSAFAVPAQVDQAYRLANQEREVRYLRFDPATYRDEVNVSDADIQSYYDAHPDQFRRPARAKLAYVELRRDGSGDRDHDDSQGAPDTQALKTIYEQNKARFQSPEQRSGAQIRVPIDSANPGAARSTIQKLAAAVKSNPDSFGKVARNTDAKADYSQIKDATRARLPPAVGGALFGLDKGGVSSPVRGDDAWYLLRLDKITSATTAAFDDPEVQAKLKTMARKQQSQKTYNDKSDRMESLAYEAPNGLDTLAEELDLKIRHSDWITQKSGPGIGQYAAIRKAAFSDSVSKDKLNSTPIQIGSDRRVVLRVADSQPAERQPLKAVRADIRERVAGQKATDKARAAAEKALKKLKSGRGMAQLAGDDARTSLEKPGYLKRSGKRGDRGAGDAVDARIRAAAFKLLAPSGDQPSYDLTPTSDGAIALVAVTSVRDGGEEGESQRKQFASQQRDYTAGLEYAALTAYLRSKADVSIDEDQIR